MRKMRIPDEIRWQTLFSNGIMVSDSNLRAAILRWRFPQYINIEYKNRFYQHWDD